jgi:hypothetical protein
MTDILGSIDEAVAYLESPEYLKQKASESGISAYSALAPSLAVQAGPLDYDLSEYDPPEYDPLDYVSVDYSEIETTLAAARNARQQRMTPIQMTTRRSPWEFGIVLEARRPFKTYGNLRGVTRSQGAGKLRDATRRGYELRLPFTDYYVYSYHTPIAWHVNYSTIDDSGY